jgi:hypothetical protein
MSRQIYAVCLKCLFSLVLLLSIVGPALAQSTAAINGLVQDTSDALIPNANVKLINTATGTESNSSTNKSGSFVLPSVMPGHYTLQIEREGFDTTQLTGITLNVGDNKSVVIRMKVGSKNETVTVDGSGLQINTTDASVSTVIDRKFVENTPLNGRSFQSLILLTPGAVTTSPQRTSSTALGDISVNGQRTESNYYTVDGVSAVSTISSAAAGSGTSGSLPASTALGTTQALVSVDALQEFRVESSTYSAEYGRNPGGQISMVTRSGTNDWHGNVFDYFRNEALDANSWFNDNTVPITRKPPERQNDFGGTLGGPIRIPHLYNGKNRTFFFFSYEGLRLSQPTAAGINVVPTLALRQSVSGPMQQVLKAFPLPTPGAPDLGNGLGDFIGSWTNPSHVDTTSIRLDHNLGERVHLFFRFTDTPSDVVTRGTSANGVSPSTLLKTAYLTRTYTAGATAHISHNVGNDFRLNFSSNNGTSSQALDGLGGAIPVDINGLQSLVNPASTTITLLFAGYFTGVSQGTAGGKQRQWNLVDSVNITHGSHAIKVGIDLRRLAPTIVLSTPYVVDYFYSAASVQASSLDLGFAQSSLPNYPLYTNFSAFIEDTWRATSRLSVSSGIRWDVNPPPGVSRGLMPYTVSGLNDLSTMTLAPQGTPLWKISWYNFAPRLGVAYVLNADPDRQTVLRGGGGVFFDTGQQAGSAAYGGPGFATTNVFGRLFGTPTNFPAPVALNSPLITQPPVPKYGTIYVNPPHFQLPYTFHWNASLEQALGRSQSLSISYVGANGRKLLELASINAATFNPNFSTLYLYKNGLTSSYNSLQLKYQRQVTRGLQALVSYTWSHSLDYGSYNTYYPYERGNSDFDVRHNVVAALSYDLPAARLSSSVLRSLTSNWGIDGRFTARTGFPVTLEGNSYVDPNTHQTYYGRLNLVPNTPLYLYGSPSLYPGGRRINPAAFTLPATGQIGNAPRNFVNGFGAAQGDLAIRRSFAIYESLRLQFRAEAFNISNHPNFGLINTTFGNVQFGKATQILAQSIGTLSPLYQTGGPRSLQLSLKLTY